MKIKKFEEYSCEPQTDEEQKYHVSGEETTTIDFDPDMEEKDDDEIDEAADPTQVTSKDTMRISDIMHKANGNTEKALQLARQMAKSVTDRFKALRRARAAEMERHSELADIFFKRAMELGAMGA